MKIKNNTFSKLFLLLCFAILCVLSSNSLQADIRLPPGGCTVIQPGKMVICAPHYTNHCVVLIEDGGNGGIGSPFICQNSVRAGG